jgi:proline iminopeptidase
MTTIILAVLSSASAQTWQDEYAAKLESEHSWERRAGVQAVDPRDPRGVETLLELFAEQDSDRVDWYVRRAAIDTLAEFGGKARRPVLKALRSRDERVREGVVLALGVRRDPSEIPTILRRVDDRAVRVRRAAIQALAQFPDERQAVEGVLACWESQPFVESRLGVECYRALRAMTDWEEGLSPARWRTFWDNAKHDWPRRPGAKAADPDQTRVRGVQLTWDARGEGLPLLVIPDHTIQIDFYKPWLASLEDVCRVIYMQLPEVGNFDPLRVHEFAPGLPYYPVDLLVEAFEALREQKGIERFALLAHGYNSLIALRYLSRYPDRVSHVVLVGPISGDRSWLKIVNGIQREGDARDDVELSKMARNLLVSPGGERGYQPASTREWYALLRKTFGLYFGDRSDPAIWELYLQGMHERERWESVTPAFELSAQRKVDVPMLVQMGKQSLLTTRKDADRFRAHYRARVVTYRRSAMCPFVEEAQSWSRDVREFLAGGAAGTVRASHKR